MPIFLEDGIFKVLCYYKLLFLRILPKHPERCSCLSLEGLPHLLIPFCLKLFAVGVVCRSLQAALVRAARVTLDWSGKKWREHKSCLHSYPLCSSYCHYLPRDYSRNWAIVFLPLPIFPDAWWCPEWYPGVSPALKLGSGSRLWGQQAQAALQGLFNNSSNSKFDLSCSPARQNSACRGFWPLASCVPQLLKVLQPNRVLTSSRGSMRRRNLSQCFKNKGKF